mgnify:CR=1 FL=1
MPNLLAIAIHRASRAPMETLTEAAVTLERGVANDFRGKPGKRQVTVVAREGWQEACRTLGAEVPWTARRANLLVEGVALAQTTGRRLRIGELELEITGETTPCHRMDEARDGLQTALKPDWRAGVTCRVVKPGTIRVGDAVELTGP